MILDKIIGGPVKSIAEKAGWKFIDDKLGRLYPKAWPAVKHALVGWKTLTGLAIVYWPTIMAGAQEGIGVLNQILSLIGVHATVNAAAFVVFLGKALFTIGAIDKALKFVLHFYAPVPDDQTAEMFRDETEMEAFLNRYATLRHEGQEWQSARRDAFAFVVVNRKS